MTSEAAVMCHSDSRTSLGLAKAEHHASQRAVVDVDDARPADRGGSMFSVVAAEEVVVEERGRQVVRRGDRVQVAGEVEVDVLHRQDLAVATARGAALEAENGTEADGWRIVGAARTPILLRPWASPMVVVVLPSPSGVGVIAVTTISRPSGWSAQALEDATAEAWPCSVPYRSKLVLGQQPKLGGDVGDGAQRRLARDLEAGLHRRV